MISVIVYGRNDSYGYNLHKRAAISLNCIAEVLTDLDDEILFVDYNTPDDFPTFPEAIQDTLTEKAQQKIRVLRARAPVHERFRAKTHLIALEPISRNIGVRRSNPANRWILSTNTDIVFILQRGSSLSDVARDLPSGFYEAPRLEIPETLWEGLDRRNPREIIDTVKKLGRTLHLDEIVYGSDTILYDGPGDFQLMERDAIFAINGFHEEMLLGWHVDSNLCARMLKRYGKISDAGAEVLAYHCDHTRQITPMHGHGRKQNDQKRFITDVQAAEVESQKDQWGCPDAPIEEIRLRARPSQYYVKALEDAIGAPLAEPYQAKYRTESYDHVPNVPTHILPFLTDIFSSAPKTQRVAWFGETSELLVMFLQVWRELGFKEPIFIAADMAGGPPINGTRLLDHGGFGTVDTFVFDAGGPVVTSDDDRTNDESGQKLLLHLMRAVYDEYQRKAAGTGPLRRFVGVNAIHNWFETFFMQFIGTSATPFSSRIRHGFILPLQEGPLQEGPVELMPALQLGPAGRRTESGGIIGIAKRNDWIFYGGYRPLFPGSYRLQLHLSAGRFLSILHNLADRLGVFGMDRLAYLEVLTNGWRVAVKTITAADVAAGVATLDFQAALPLMEDHKPLYEVRLRSLTGQVFHLTSVSMTLLSLFPPGEPVSTFHLVGNMLPAMSTGSGGRFKDAAIEALNDGRPGLVTYGPHWPLQQGDYRVSFNIDIRGTTALIRKPELFVAEVVCRAEELIHRQAFGWREDRTYEFDFTISEKMAGKAVEYRIFTDGHTPLRLRSVTLKRLI